MMILTEKLGTEHVYAYKCVDTSVWKLLSAGEVEFIQNVLLELI